MRLFGTLFVLVFLSLKASAQEHLPAAIDAAYGATLTALQSAKSADDIHRMVEAMDAPDWVSIDPTGAKMSRNEAERQLVGLLSIPVGQRPIPKQKTVYVGEQDKRVVVVYWVWRTTDKGSVGSLVRDSWVQTAAGWRRSMHEKIFPDRLLELP
jgi:hypothetical protein